MTQPPTLPVAQPPRRILIVRLSAHGDVIHTLPLLSAIKQADPNAHAGWLVEAAAAPLLESHPLIDALHVADRKRWLKLARNPLRWPRVITEIRQFVRELQIARYEISLDVQGLLKSALWPWLAKIPRRYGFARTREQAARLYTDTVSPMDIRDPSVPAVDRYLDFARALGYPVTQPQFVLPPVSPEHSSHIAELLGNDTRPLVVLAPFTRWASKHWRSEHWPVLIEALLKQDVRLAILGAPGDQPATEAMLKALPEIERGRVHNLVGHTDWPDLYALFAQTRLVIGLDSAPAHIADAVGVPDVIALFGPTAPGRTGPIGKQHTVLSTKLSCQPCFERVCPLGTHACMKELTPQTVMAAVQSHLGMKAGLS